MMSMLFKLNQFSDVCTVITENVVFLYRCKYVDVDYPVDIILKIGNTLFFFFYDYTCIKFIFSLSVTQLLL